MEESCKNGQWCVKTTCYSSCSDDMTCMKEWLTDDFETKQKDCLADPSDDCEDVCEWVSCLEDGSDDLYQCW